MVCLRIILMEVIMKESELLNDQIKLNAVSKAIDDLYHSLSVKYNMSDSALWIFYTLRIMRRPMTQSELCNYIFQSKQTINSSLKKLVDEGYLAFEMSPNNKKNKFIILTEKGSQIVEEEIDPVIKCESNVLNRLGDERRKLFVELYQEYYSLLKKELEGIGENG